MDKINKTSKIFLYLTVLTGSLWLGAYVLRLFLTYHLFTVDLELKPFAQENLHGVVQLLLPAITSTFILYIAFIFFFILFILTAKINLRENGWLFIIAVIVLFCLPFEIYLMTIDYSLINQLYSGNYDSKGIIDLFIKRIKILGSFPLIEIFCYMSLYYFLLFRPFTKKLKAANEN